MVVKEFKPLEFRAKSAEKVKPVNDAPEDERARTFSFDEMLKARGKYSFTNQHQFTNSQDPAEDVTRPTRQSARMAKMK